MCVGLAARCCVFGAVGEGGTKASMGGGFELYISAYQRHARLCKCTGSSVVACLCEYDVSGGG